MGDVGMPKLDRVNVRRAIKDAFLDGLETACKGIKPLEWTVEKHGMSARTFVGLLVEKERRYVVIKECNCARCGKNISFEMSEPMSRAELLQEGWFVQSEPIWISRPYVKYKQGNWRIAK